MLSISLRYLPLAVLIACACCTSAQVTTGKTQARSLDVVAADLLKAGDVPGGVEVISGCSAIPLRAFEVGSMSCLSWNWRSVRPLR